MDSGDNSEPANDELMIPKFRYDVLLAETATTQVYKGMMLPNGANYAIKVINLEALKEQELETLMYQMKICKGLSHPNLIPHKYSLVQESSVIIVSEVQFIKLSDVIVKLFPEGIREFELVCTILRPIACALEYLHSKNLIHRNISSSSVFMRDNGEVTVNYYCHLEKGKQSGLKSSVYRNLCYLSPEILQETESGYDKRVDIWSFGILAHELVTGRNPFSEDSCYESMKKILNDAPPQFQGTSKHSLKKNFLKIIQKCLSKDPALRPTATEIRKYLERYRTNSKHGLLKEKIIDRIFHIGAKLQTQKSDIYLEFADEFTKPTP